VTAWCPKTLCVRKDVGVEELSVRYAVPGKKSDGSDLCKELGVTLLVKQS
jgi:hypothetical protein